MTMPMHRRIGWWAALSVGCVRVAFFAILVNMSESPPIGVLLPYLELATALVLVVLFAAIHAGAEPTVRAATRAAVAFAGAAALFGGLTSFVFLGDLFELDTSPAFTRAWAFSTVSWALVAKITYVAAWGPLLGLAMILGANGIGHPQRSKAMRIVGAFCCIAMGVYVPGLIFWGFVFLLMSMVGVPIVCLWLLPWFARPLDERTVKPAPVEIPLA